MSRSSFLALIALSIAIESAPAEEGRDRSGTVAENERVDGNLHKSTARSDPERIAATDEKKFRIDRSAIESEEWQAAIKRALSHQAGRGYYTLMRVLVDDAAPGETIQAQATKLKELTERYDGGGGEFRVLPSGGFVFFEHINSTRRRNGRDPVKLGAFSHGTTQIWVDEPPAGVLGVLGDVILSRCPTEEMGVLSIKLKAPPAVHEAKLTIGPVVVGGPYGAAHTIDTSREFQLRLPPGSYKILLPDFDPRNGRWDVAIEPKKFTRLTFRQGWQVEKADDVKKPSGLSNETPVRSSAPVASDERADGSATIRQLQNERLATLTELQPLFIKQYKSGLIDFDKVRDADSAYTQASLDTCQTKAERVAILERAVTQAESLKAIAADRAAAGEATEMLKAKAYLLEARIALERAR